MPDPVGTIHSVDEAIMRYAGEGSFIDIGPLWGTVNEKITVAARAGAKRLAAADIHPIWHDAWSMRDLASNVANPS